MNGNLDLNLLGLKADRSEGVLYRGDTCDVIITGNRGGGENRGLEKVPYHV